MASTICLKFRIKNLIEGTYCFYLPSSFIIFAYMFYVLILQITLNIEGIGTLFGVKQEVSEQPEHLMCMSCTTTPR